MQSTAGPWSDNALTQQTLPGRGGEERTGDVNPGAFMHVDALRVCLTHFLVISRMLCRVTPGRMIPSRGGVASSSTGKEFTEHNKSQKLSKLKKIKLKK